MKVSVDIVKYRDMPSRQWYMSPRHKTWYYHSSRQTPSSELAPQFLEATLDPPLRLMALGLNSLGYTTLPSCSGHYKTAEELNETYSHLVEDARSVRKDGLELVDTETGEATLHHDSSWYLPWDRRAFSAAVNVKPEGYVGFQVPTSHGYTVGKAVDNAVKDVKGSRYEVLKKPNSYVFELRVHTGKQRSQDAAWQDLGDTLLLGLIRSFPSTS